MAVIRIFTDGGSRGNPGPAAIGIYIVGEKGKEYLRLGKQIGKATNNVAEYTAVITALEWVKRNFQSLDKLGTSLSIVNYQFFLDSLLVVNQLNGIFKIKDDDLKKLSIRIKNLEKEITGRISYQYIPREKNKTADFLLNKAF